LDSDKADNTRLHWLKEKPGFGRAAARDSKRTSSRIRGKEAGAEIIGEETAYEKKSGDCHAAVNGRDWL
jgi:hypothetical protein